MQHGAITLLGEDYGYKARAVLVGAKGWQDPHNRFSLELCGGTHVSNTSEIETFKVAKESSVAAGIRRIEAVAGPAASEWVVKKAEAHKAMLAQLVAKQDALLKEIARFGRASRSLRDARGGVFARAPQEPGERS